MRKYLYILLVLFPAALQAQDTIRVRSHKSDDYCWPAVYSKGVYYADSLPQAILTDDSKLELRVNEECPVKKRADVFVSSFELELKINGVPELLKVNSSFFTDKQKSSIRRIAPGSCFFIKNLVVHAPDGFRKMEDLKIFVK